MDRANCCSRADLRPQPSRNGRLEEKDLRREIVERLTWLCQLALVAQHFFGRLDTEHVLFFLAG